MKFFTILGSMGMDRRFINLLKSVPRKQLDNLGVTRINMLATRDWYRKKKVQDMSVDPSANVNGKSPHNLRSEQMKPWSKLMGLHYTWKKSVEMFGEERAGYIIGEALKGHVYIHDLSKFDVPYCFSIGLKNVLDFGLPFTNPVAVPPKHPMSFSNQCVELVMKACQEQAGAIALSSYPPCMASIIHEGEKQWSRKEIENIFQHMVHVFNHPFRVGGDSPFTNMSIFSPTFLDEMYANNVYGEFSYEDIRETVNWVQDIMMDFMARGDPTSGLMYRFPIMTLNIHPADFDTPEVKKMLMYNARGYFNINVTDQLALCCRLQVKKRERVSSLGTGGDNIGSLRVVTINNPSVVYQGGDPAEVLDDRLEVCHDLLRAVKEIIMEWSDQHTLFKLGWMHGKMFYLTVGGHGVAEQAMLMSGSGKFDDEWFGIEKEILQHVDEVTSSWDDADYNFEMVPAEGSTRTMADSNKIIHGASDRFYSNQFVPLYADIPLHDRLKYESMAAKHVSGGSMCFVNLDGYGDPEAVVNIQEKILKNYDIPQFAINIGKSQCPSCLYTAIGKASECPHCGSEMIFYTRIVGFFTPSTQWEERRLEELESRRWYDEWK